MNEISVNYRPLSDDEIQTLGAKVHLAITTEPCMSYFASFKPTAAELEAHNLAFTAALAKETSVSVTALRRSKRELLVGALTELAAFLEIEAKGDLMKLAATGFDLKKRGSRTGAPTPIPQNLRLSVTGISSEVLARCNPVKGSRNYQAQHSLSSDGPWTDIDPTTSSQKILFTGLQRGKDIYIRVRAFGPNGYSGWSDIATLMVV